MHVDFLSKSDSVREAPGVALAGDSAKLVGNGQSFFVRGNDGGEEFAREFLPEMVEEILHRTANAAVIIGRAKNVNVGGFDALFEVLKPFGLMRGIGIEQGERFTEEVENVDAHARSFQLVRNVEDDAAGNGVLIQAADHGHDVEPGFGHDGSLAAFGFDANTQDETSCVNCDEKTGTLGKFGRLVPPHPNPLPWGEGDTPGQPVVRGAAFNISSSFRQAKARTTNATINPLLPATLRWLMLLKMNSRKFLSSRRAFLKSSVTASMGLALGGCTHVGSQRGRRISPNEKLNIGFIGAGGRATDNIRALEGENIVALCDVDQKNAAASFSRYPNAKRYRDFRKMLEAEKSLDAVVVSTPDHIHAIAAITAMQHGKHVYCEKPLAHSIYEARRMRLVAAEMGVVTQMGQQGHAMEGSRRAVEVIRSGAIGEVRELHVWTDRPADWWPQGMERPTDTAPVPETLDWDLWLGPAPWRPYNPAYLPFKWRGIWDFGTGAIGDMGVHNLDTAYWALELGLPTSARIVDSSGATKDSPPKWSILELSFPSGKRHGPLKLTWYDGKKLPPQELFQDEARTGNGSLVIGSKGTLYTRDWHGGSNPKDMFLLLPKGKFEGYVPPQPTLPRTPEHHIEWVRACKGGPKAQSSFAYASVLTEALLVGMLALRTGKEIEWDAKNMRATNCPQADQFIHPQFRSGWEI